MVHVFPEKLEKKEFDKFIVDHKDVVVDFFAEWCGPCKQIAPIFEELSKEHHNIKFCKVDVDTCADLAGSCGVRAMPTFHFYKGGEKVSEVVGANVDKIKLEIAQLKK